MKKLLSLLVSVLFCLSFVSAVGLSIDNYYPSPVEAGDYFTIKLKVTNTGNENSDLYVRFIESYPFSLDPGESDEKLLRDVESGSSSSATYSIRTDAGSKEGENLIKFQYKGCLGCVWQEKSIPLTVIEAQTLFDVVLQEISSDGVYIAIANIGKNPANAVTIRIPEQENFGTQLISASIVGNLESGDYTIVGFQITSKAKSMEEKPLTIQIDYTDPLGVRRTIFGNIMLNPSSLARTTAVGSIDTSSGVRGFNQKSSFFSGFWFWTDLVLLVILFRKQLLRLYRRLKLRHKR